MIKKLISMVLVLLMILSSLTVTTLAKETINDKIYDEFSDFFVKEKSFEKITQNVGSSAYNNVKSITTELPFTLRAYYMQPNTKNIKRDIPVVFYIVNHAMERIGTEDDISIIKDLLEEGYIVFTLDYQNNPKAISPDIDWSILGARNQVMNSINEYFPNVSYSLSSKVNYSYVVPAGCRIERDILYFNLLESGAIGTKEKIVDAWNSAGFKAKASKIPANTQKGTYKGDWYKAETIDDCVKPDGSPLDFELKMDIVYPSKPKSAPPVFALASSSETRTGSTTHSSRPHYIGFLMRGFAAACYDHEYIPMSRNDHYGYFNPFSLAALNGVKTHTAAIRCIRQYADDFGYNKDKIGVWGHSKSSYSALLGRENPELLTENSKSEGTYGPQPNLTYEGTNTPIPSNVQAVYTSMGDGTKLHNKLVNETTVPSIIAAGKEDEFGAWDYWDVLNDTYKKFDVQTLRMGMLDLGHEYPYGIDTEYGYDRYAAALDFFDHHLNNKAPKLVYTYPVDKFENYDTNSPVIVKLNSAVDEKEFTSKVKITDEKGKAVNGVWTPSYGNTEFTFITEEFKNGVTYKITVPSNLKSKNGINFEKKEHTFKVKSGDMFFASKTGEKNVTVAHGKTDGYFEFDLSAISKENRKDISNLYLNVENNAAQIIMLYGVDKDGKETYITENEVTGSGIVKFDISDYIKGISSTLVKFKAAAKIAPGKLGLTLDFENLDEVNTKRSKEGDPSPVSDKYIFRFGGEPIGAELYSDANGKSLLFKRKNSFDRIKFYNTFGENELTEDDIGKTYRITFDAKGAEDATLNIGIMAAYSKQSGFKYATNMFGKTGGGAIKANEWTTITFDYTIGEENIKDKISCLTIQTSDSAKDIYIDNIRVEECATDVVFTSTDGANLSEGKSKPKLVIATDETLKEIEKDGYKLFVSADEIKKVTAEKSIKATENTSALILVVYDKNGKISDVKMSALKNEDATLIASTKINKDAKLKILTWNGKISDASVIAYDDLK